MARKYRRDSQGRFAGGIGGPGKRVDTSRTTRAVIGVRTRRSLPRRATVALNARKAGIHSLALANGALKQISVRDSVRSIGGDGVLSQTAANYLGNKAFDQGRADVLNAFKTTSNKSGSRIKGQVKTKGGALR